MALNLVVTSWTKTDLWFLSEAPRYSRDWVIGEDGVRVSVDLFNMLVQTGSKPKHRIVNEEIDVWIMFKINMRELAL